jgi:hypothetical protein
VDQQYLPNGLARGAFYQPSERGWEAYRSDAIKRDREAQGFVSPTNNAEGGASPQPAPTSEKLDTVPNAAHEAELKRKTTSKKKTKQVDG